jgi:hypothetical protein
MTTNGNDVPEMARPIVHISKEGLRSVVSLKHKVASSTFMLTRYQIQSVFEDCLHNIVHDTVLEIYREEKMLRMQSAAVQVESLALSSAGLPVTPTIGTPATTKPSGAVQAPVQGKFETEAATYENGKVHLKGNPLELVKDNFCSNCKLPTLMHPLMGINARVPVAEDADRNYCSLQPFIQRASGLDIFGLPFPIDQTNKTKKEREHLKKLERAEKDSTPGSTDTGTGNDKTGPEATVDKLKIKSSKTATYMPWQSCTQGKSCTRSIQINKFAQHLQSCMGIGGRAVRNSTKDRLSGNNDSNSVSRAGSRVSTPAPATTKGNNKRSPPAKKPSPSAKKTSPSAKKPSPPAKKTSPPANKKSPPNANKKRAAVDDSDDFDFDGDEGPPKKKAKPTKPKPERKEKVIIKIPGTKKASASHPASTGSPALSVTSTKPASKTPTPATTGVARKGPLPASKPPKVLKATPKGAPSSTMSNGAERGRTPSSSKRARNEEDEGDESDFVTPTPKMKKAKMARESSLLSEINVGLSP